MPLDPKKVDEFLSLTRQESAAAVRPKSRLEPHREAILAAVAEGLPITAIRKVLEVHCDVKVTYTSLREWIKRQRDSNKGKGVIKKPAKTKEQLAAWERLKAHNPDDPLTLEYISTTHKNYTMPKRIVFTQGGKGGVGKTTAALSLFDYYQTKSAAVTLADFDGENRAKSGLNFWHKSADKVDIHTRSGLDALIALTLNSGNDIILADMGAGSGAVTYKWFATVYPDLAAEGVKFTSIGMITADPGSVESVVTWAQHLGDNVQYLIILNELDQPDETFKYWHESKQAKDFIAYNSPKIIKMESRRPDLEQAARNHGVSLAQIAERKAKAPELNNAALVIRAQGYRRRINAEFDTAADILFP